MGSKARHAKHIAPILMADHNQSKPYIEPFLGGGNMMANVPADIRIGGDVAKYAVSLLRAVASGWVPPSVVSEQFYHDVRQDKDSYPPELVGFVGYSCSFGGYDEIDYPVGSTVYMDPPYAGTTKYKSGDFDHDMFWRFCESLSATCRVFVSEYTSPPNWLPVWEKHVTSSLTMDTGSLRATEKLFTTCRHLKEPET
jgi:DNA adenine methylase